jgi:parallel beta-helix repeat protein
LLGNATNANLASHDNVVENNVASGNTNGFVIGTLTQGNVIRGNLIVGNPPVQISVQDPTAGGVDIRNESSAGANTFEDNRCLTYTGAGSAPCPSVGNLQEDAEQEAVAAFVRNRLASQARVFNAAYRLNSPFLPKAAGFAAPGQPLSLIPSR